MSRSLEGPPCAHMFWYQISAASLSPSATKGMACFSVILLAQKISLIWKSQVVMFSFGVPWKGRRWPMFVDPLPDSLRLCIIIWLNWTCCSKSFLMKNISLHVFHVFENAPSPSSKADLVG